MSNLQIEDSVMAVFGFSENPSEESWPILSVYRAFRDLKDNYPALFGTLHFSERGGSPYSKELEQLFFSMGTAKLLEVRNPEYGCYSIGVASRTTIQDYLGKILDTDDCELAKEVAGKFRARLKEINTVSECAI